MKKISKIIMCIMSTVVIVFSLPLPALARYSSWTQTSREDFEAGTKTNIDTASEPGSFRLSTGVKTLPNGSFENGSGSNPFNFDNWTEHISETGNFSGDIYRNSSIKKSGNYSAELLAYRISDGYGIQYVWIKSDPFNYRGGDISVWYRIGTDSSGGTQGYSGAEISIFCEPFTGAPITIDWFPNEHIDDTWRQKIFDKSLFDACIGKNLQIKISCRASDPIISIGYPNKVDKCHVYYDLVQYTAYESSGELISQNHHFGTELSCWGPIEITKTLNGQTVTIKTQTAPDNGGVPDAWEEEKELDANGRPRSTIYSDTWFRWIAYLSTSDRTQTPVVNDVTVYWDPYPDAPTLTAPEHREWINNNKPLFDWDFNDDCPGSTQEGFHLIIDDNPDFPGVYYDSGFQDSTISQWQFPDGTGYTTIPDGVWYWKCCTKNNYDLWGATSTYSMFQIDTTPPPTPVMVPEPELTSGQQNVVKWNSVEDTVDGYGGPIKYYVECSSDSSFILKVDNSGWIEDPFCTFGTIEALKDGVTYYYRVKAKDGLDNESGYSAAVRSRQYNPIITNYYASPNPFSPNEDGIDDETRIYYTILRDCRVTIKIYDSKGGLKKTLVNEKHKSKGVKFETVWDGKDKDGIVPNGIYTYRIAAKAKDQTGDTEEKRGTVRVQNLVTIDSTIPEHNGYFVIGEDKDIEIRFNRHMSSSTMTTENISIIDEAGDNVELTKIDYASSVTIITPLQKQMKYCTTYTVGVSTDATDYLEIPLTEEESFSFTTLIPGTTTNWIRIEHKEAVVEIDDPSETFPKEGKKAKGWYIKLVEAGTRSPKDCVGKARLLRCYKVVKVDDNINEIDIGRLDRRVTIAIYPRDKKYKKNLKLYFYNKEINRWELVRGSECRKLDDGDYYVTGEVKIANTEYCVKPFAMGGLIEKYSNYPNPFKAGKEETTIEYELEEDAKVTISIYDLLGQLVRRMEKQGTKGLNTDSSWDGRNERGRVVANGGYYCVLEADTETGKHMKKVRKIMVIK